MQVNAGCNDPRITGPASDLTGDREVSGSADWNDGRRGDGCAHGRRGVRSGGYQARGKNQQSTASENRALAHVQIGTTGVVHRASVRQQSLVMIPAPIDDGAISGEAVLCWTQDWPARVWELTVMGTTMRAVCQTQRLRCQAIGLSARAPWRLVVVSRSAIHAMTSASPATPLARRSTVS